MKGNLPGDQPGKCWHWIMTSETIEHETRGYRFHWTSSLAKNLWVIVMTPPTLTLTIQSFVWDLLGTFYVPGLVDTGDTRMNKVWSLP